MFILLTAISLFAWLSWVAASPDGQRTVTWIPGEFSPFVTTPLPGERVSAVKESSDENQKGSSVSLIGEPTYIGVFPPSDAFTSATVTVEFDSNEAFAFEIGGLTNLAAYAFDFRPLSNRVVESLGWFRLVSDDDRAVFAKYDVKATADDFFSHLPSQSSVVTYRAGLPGVYRDPSYMPITTPQTFNVSLRGSHEYVTYIKNETLSLMATYHDVNRTYGADEGYVHVYNEAGERIYRDVIVDDGNISEDQMYTLRTLSLSIPDLSEGVYRVELSGTSDIIWRQFVTNQRYLSFKQKMYIADDVGYLSRDRMTSFVTNSKSLAFETFHATSASSVQIGEHVIPIPNPHTLTRTIVDDDGVVSGGVDRGDVKMVGEGKFAFSAQSFFDPDPRVLTPVTNLDDSALQYFVASVPEVQITDEGWRTASATFDLSSLVQESGAYKFAFSIPGQAIDGEFVDIHRITVTFHKTPISIRRAMSEEVRRWYHAIADRLW